MLENDDSSTTVPDGITALLQVIADEDADDEQVDTAVHNITDTESRETAVPLIGALLIDQSKSLTVRLHSVYALQILALPNSAPFLNKALINDPQDSVKYLSLTAFEEFPVKGIPTFLHALNLSDERFKIAATRYLGDAVRLLVRAWEDAAEDEREPVEANLSQIPLDNYKKLLYLPITPQDVNQGITIPETAATAMGIIQGTDAVSHLCEFLRKEQKTLDEIEDATGVSDEKRTEQLFQDVGSSRVMSSAITALRNIGTPEVVACIAVPLEENLNFRVRRTAANALGRLEFDSVIAPLIKAFLQDSSNEVRSTTAAALIRLPKWQLKIEEALKVLKKGAQLPGEIDAVGLVKVTNPPETELSTQPNLLVDYLIEQTAQYADDQRLLPIMALLIVACVDNDQAAAGQRIDAYRDRANIPDESLQFLRIQIGGPAAMAPIMNRMEKDLKTYFQDPIKNLNEETQVVWQKTVTAAQWGFKIRAALSVILFGIGAFLVIDSYLKYTSGELDLASFAGPGATFLGGLGTMFSMVFWGPLKHIRKAVNDVGVANIAFIAYIHRILQISHTFSDYYLKGNISFEELEKASKLIEDTMDDTIRVLLDTKHNEEDSEIMN